MLLVSGGILRHRKIRSMGDSSNEPLPPTTNATSRPTLSIQLTGKQILVAAYALYHVDEFLVKNQFYIKVVFSRQKTF